MGSISTATPDMGMKLHNIQIGGTVLKSTVKENDLGLNISAGMSSVEL